MFVRARDDPAEQIAGSRDLLRLEDLCDLTEASDDRIVLALGDLEGGEGEHPIAEGGQVYDRLIARDDPPGLQAVETRLDRVASLAAAPRQLEDVRSRHRGER